MPETGESIRIGKLLARVGLAPRRATAAFLTGHKVEINGIHITDLNFILPTAEISSARLVVDGKPIAIAGDTEVLILHKTRGVACSHKEQRPQGRPLKTIFSLLPIEYASWFFAGRLDVSSEGLVVLSNDGNHIFHLSHPSHQVLKKYYVKTSRPLSGAELARAVKGVFDKGEKLRFAKIVPHDKPAEYIIDLYEGKNREIRRLLERLGVFARQLIRLELGPYKLSSIPSGEFRLMPKVPVEIPVFNKANKPADPSH
jgi:23S rRNA pseudouridine2605 synthase